MSLNRVSLMVCVGAAAMLTAAAQTEQKGADRSAHGSNRLRVDYVGYRPASYETEKLFEPQNARPNVGGLLYFYMTNVSDKTVDLAFWRYNNQDESHWRLNGPIAWDRCYDHGLEPGEMGVLEINGVTEDFGPGREFEFAYVERGGWRPAVRFEGVLDEDPVQIALIRGLEGLGELEIHVRNRGAAPVEVAGAEVAGAAVKRQDWVGQRLDGRGGHAIGRLELAQPLSPARLTVVKVTLEEAGEQRAIYAHRRIFEDWFPIGCWSNRPELYQELRSIHIDTGVRGGRADDAFYGGEAQQWGFRSMAHTGIPTNVDQVRSLSGHPVLACWMLQDEPDWSTQPCIMLHCDTAVRRYDRTKPTLITLCRNVKFFEYAPICDLPCMDHYCVTAPTSSKWPKYYGAYLEETGLYTRDLKLAAEPKPIWVWSQGIAGWNERPKQPIPTPNELAVQLLQNLGYGAKGIIWFNYDQERARAYPDTLDAVRGWGRVMRAARGDFLASEPLDAVIRAPEKVDALPLVTRDTLLVCLTNRDYEFDSAGYPFTTQEAVRVVLRRPGWIDLKTAFRVGPGGVTAIAFEAEGGRITVEAGDLEAAALIVLANDANAKAGYEAAFAQAIADEARYAAME